MTGIIEIPRPIGQAMLAEVYRVAESLFLASGGEIPNGCSFARSINETADRCFAAAAIAYYNRMQDNA